MAQVRSTVNVLTEAINPPSIADDNIDMYRVALKGLIELTHNHTSLRGIVLLLEATYPGVGNGITPRHVDAVPYLIANSSPAAAPRWQTSSSFRPENLCMTSTDTVLL